MRPDKAARIWIDRGQINLELFAQVGERSHVLTFPNCSVGLAQALTVLNARPETARIGEAGAPTRRMLAGEQNPNKIRRVGALTSGLLEPLGEPQHNRTAMRDIIRKAGLL